MNPTPDEPIYIAGHRGMVGSAVARALQRAGHANLILKTHAELDLCDAAAVDAFFAETRPALVIDAAARVGGIHANSAYPAEFIRDNLAMTTNLVHSAWRHGVKRFLFLGSSCIYPKFAPQPIPESALLTGPLEETNEPYAVAKIAGLKLCQFYRKQYGVLFHSAMPTNLYGPGDNYHPENAHVIPAMIRRFHEAKLADAPAVALWGTGTPRREFLHADDLADALLAILGWDDPPDWVNVGCGEDIAIRDLAERIRETAGFRGRLEWDAAKPDGTPRKLLDVGRLFGRGWKPKIALADGLAATYRDFLLRFSSCYPQPGTR
jgi:GDP-L-fucose synthase